jgi:hypothetical protein
MIQVDESQWPLVRFTSRGTADEGNFDTYLRSYDRVLAHGQRYVAIFDASEAKPLEVGQMKAQAAWIRANAQRLIELNLGIAFVIPSPMIRGVLKAVLWLQPLPQPYTVVGSYDDAYRWVETKARLGDIYLPAR